MKTGFSLSLGALAKLDNSFDYQKKKNFKLITKKRTLKF